MLKNQPAKSTKSTPRAFPRWLLFVVLAITVFISWQRFNLQTDSPSSAYSGLENFLKGNSQLALASSNPELIDVWAQQSDLIDLTGGSRTNTITKEKVDDLVEIAKDKNIKLEKLLTAKQNLKAESFKGEEIEFKSANSLIFSVKDSTTSGNRSEAITALNESDPAARASLTYEFNAVGEAAEYLANNAAYQRLANKDNFSQDFDFENSSDIEMSLLLSNNSSINVSANFSPYFSRLASSGNILDFSLESRDRADLTNVITTFDKQLPLKAQTVGEVQTKKVFLNPDLNLLANAKRLELPYFNEFAQNSVFSMDTILPIYSNYNFVSKSYNIETCFDYLVSAIDNPGEPIEIDLSLIPGLGDLFTSYPTITIQPDQRTIFSTKTRLCAKDIYAAVRMDISKEVFNNRSISEGYDPQTRFREIFSEAFFKNLQANGLNGIFARAGGALATNKKYIEDNLLQLDNIFTCKDLESSQLVKYLTDKSITNPDDAENKALVDLFSNTDCLNTSGSFIVSPTVQQWCGKGWLSESYCEENAPGSKIVEICVNPTPVLFDTDLPSPDEPVTDSEGSDGNSPDGGFGSPIPGHTAVSFSAKVGSGANAHPGVDISAAIGTPIAAIADGRCIFAGPVSSFSQSQYLIWSTNANPADPANEGLEGFGRAILIEHTLMNGQKLYALYAHLNTVAGKLAGCSDSGNVTVAKGETIGASGHSGRSFNPHLHFELRKHKNASEYTKRTYYYEGPVGAAQGCGLDYCNPQCLITDAASCDFGALPIDDPNLTPPGLPGEEICTEIDPVDPIGGITPPSGEITGRYTIESLKALVAKGCSGMTSYITQSSVNLVNLVQTTGLLVERNGSQAGTRNAQQLFGAEYSPDIWGLLKRISEVTGVPASKIAAQLTMENYGPKYDDIELLNSGPKKMNGNIDEVVLRLTNPNSCGCSGTGAFCPSGAAAYLFPESNFYPQVYKCLQDIGFNQQANSPINVAYSGAGACAMAVKLKFDTGGDNGAAWEEGCCTTGGEFSPGSCRYQKASERYLGAGGCDRLPAYCEKTSNICRSDSLISNAKRIFKE